MSWPVETVLEEAFKLDPEDRAVVVAELSSSKGIATPEKAEAAWREEIARLLKSLEDGTAVLHGWNEVNAEISSILKGASRSLGFLPRPGRSSPTRSGGTAVGCNNPL